MCCAEEVHLARLLLTPGKGTMRTVFTVRLQAWCVLDIRLVEINTGSRDQTTKMSKHREAMAESIVNWRTGSNNSGRLC